MKITCLLKRNSGTQVLLGETTYDFQLNENGEHVAEVDDEAHADIFLNIPEGYCEYGKAPKKIVIEQKPATAQPPIVEDNVDDLDDDVTIEPLLGADWEPESIEYAEGLTISIVDLVNQAFEASGYTVAEWNAQSEEDVQNALDMRLAVLTPKVEKEVEVVDLMGDALDEPAQDIPSAPPVPQNLSKAERKAALKAKKTALGQR